MGLQVAVQRFDVTLGWQFSTYAHDWIEAKLKQYVASNAHALRLPAELYYVYVQLNKVRAALHGELKSEPTHAQITARFSAECKAKGKKDTSITEERVITLLEAGDRVMVYLNSGISDGEDGELLAFIPDSRDLLGDSIAALGGRQTLEILITRAGLSPREQFVLGLRFGIFRGWLDDVTVDLEDGTSIRFGEVAGKRRMDDGMTLVTTARYLKLSDERIRQIERKALAKLKNAAAAPTAKYDH